MEEVSARSARARVGRLLPWVLLLALAAVAAVQQRRVALLRLEIDTCHGAATPPGEALFEPIRLGKVLPAFTARSTEGTELEVAARGHGPSLLLIYEPGCPRCEAALPPWVELHDELRARGSEAAVVGLSLADSYSTVRHAREQGLPFPVVPFPDRSLVAAYGVGQVPITAVVDVDGRVAALWDSPLGAGARGDALELLCPQCLGSAALAAPVTDQIVGGGSK